MKRAMLVLLIGLTMTACNQQINDRQACKTQSVLHKYKDSVTDFGIVALVDNGKYLDTASLGYSFGKNAISTKNRFCIGSCTKMFTAVAVLKLQEMGLLNVNDSVCKYLPKHKFIDSTITTMQLLNHTSGLTEYLKNGFHNEPFLNPQGDFSDKVLFSRIDTIDFKNGSRYEYRNTNYFLLTKIIEMVTDKSWEANIEELIIKPLNLRNTFPYYSTTIRMLAHPIVDGQDLNSTPKLACNKLAQGAGNIVTDLLDLNSFIRALLIDKTLLHKNSLAQMTRMYSYRHTKVGLGLFQEICGSRVLLGHTGRQISYISYAFVDPKTGESIIVLNNNAKDHIIDKVFHRLCKY